MKKLLIPTILAATILVAASFAFMPVQKVMTTHLPSVGTANIADDSITSAKIADNTIVNADINTAAAIVGTKLAGDTVGGAQIADALTVDTLAGETATTVTITGGSDLIFSGNLLSTQPFETLTVASEGTAAAAAFSIVATNFDDGFVLRITCNDPNSCTNTGSITALASGTTGQILVLKNAEGSVVGGDVVVSNGDNIDAAVTLNPGEAVILLFDGTDWIVIASNV